MKVINCRKSTKNLKQKKMSKIAREKTHTVKRKQCINKRPILNVTLKICKTTKEKWR